MRLIDSNPEPGPTAEALDAPHVLVVDDEPQIRELVATALRRDGYRVSVEPDGRAALRAVSRNPDVQVVLTDLKMPRMSGLDLIRCVRELSPDVGSILITAYSSTETAVEALRTGADDYLTKPFRLDDLRETVQRVVESRRLAQCERTAVHRVREEATSLRREQVETTAKLRETEEHLRLSRSDLEKRVRDLDFLRELSALLARKGDLDRVLQTTAHILGRRFSALLTRIEVDLGDGIHVAEDVRGDVPPKVLSTMGPDLLHRARRGGGTLRDVVLGFGPPMEGLAACLDVGGRSVGGITLLRSPTTDDTAGDQYLLSLVPQTMSTAIEAENNRKRSARDALRVAMGMLDVLEGRGGLYTGHSERVARIAGEIAEAMKLSTRLRDVIVTAARLHDVGAVSIPDGVLQREGPLNDREQTVVRGHPLVGARILAPFGEAASFVRHHRERPDGAGYPDGLQGDEIPLGAGIVGVAEAFDAMTSPRPYRMSKSRREAIEEIRSLRGTQFVAGAVDGLLAVPSKRL